MTDPKGLEIIEKAPVFQGYFRIDRYRFRHALFEGGWTNIVTREVFERGHAAALLAYDPKARAFVLCEQFRIGAYAAGVDPWLLEMVAGIIEEGETPEDVARRESVEEAGRGVEAIWPIQRYLVSPGGTSESVHLYLGRVSAEGAGGIHGLADESENIRVQVMPEEKLRALMDEGKLGNAALLIAAQWFFLNRDKVREKWR